ncbi:MAG: HD domain-containing protein [Rhodobacterales bacterium]|nr:HD domain-containing protein [Rhodobacterales bacterium]
MTDRIAAQFAFLDEAGRLKQVLRASRLADGSRRENSAEHSWHLALYALVFADQAPAGVNIDRVVRMLILHDLVEIDTGDVPIHSADGQAHGSAEVQAAEAAAADRIFGLLPPDLGAPMRALWQEFEDGQTPDAVFARALDRAQPVALNLAGRGGTWVDYGVTLDQLDRRVGTRIDRGAPALWAHLRERAADWFSRR